MVSRPNCVRAGPQRAGPGMADALAERLVVARMEYYGYPTGIVTAAAAKMAQGAERGEYHRRFGCELTEHGWDCTDYETQGEQSRHPLEDEIDRTAEWVVWLLEQLGEFDTDNDQANTCPHSSATGVDTAEVGPGKVWRCDHCGLSYVQSVDGRRAVLVTADDMHARGHEVAAAYRAGLADGRRRRSVIDAATAEPVRPAHPNTQIGRR